MMVNGTVVKHWSRTQATPALSTAEAEHYAVVTVAAEGFGMQSVMADLGLSCGGAGLDRLQHRQGNRVETRSRKDRASGTEVFTVAGGTHVRESEDEASPRGAKLGRSCNEGEAVARDRRIDPRSWRIHENESARQGE